MKLTINKIKLVLYSIFILFFTILISIIVILSSKNKQLNRDIAISKTNELSFSNENSILKERNIAFQFTIEQLQYYNDSILVEMDKIRKELNIKDKDLKQIQYLLSQATKKDTIKYIDTIFVDNIFKLDTIIGDEWYQLDITLQYPNIIIVEPTFKNETYIIADYKKCTIDPPKKCAIGRLFQKKHKIVEVQVVEKNPYIINKKQRFVEIIK